MKKSNVYIVCGKLLFLSFSSCFSLMSFGYVLAEVSSVNLRFWSEFFGDILSEIVRLE